MKYSTIITTLIVVIALMGIVAGVEEKNSYEFTFYEDYSCSGKKSTIKLKTTSCTKFPKATNGLELIATDNVATVKSYQLSKSTTGYYTWYGYADNKCQVLISSGYSIGPKVCVTWYSLCMGKKLKCKQTIRSGRLS